jgi:phosphoribosylaminoimidazole-succinocarboxamide synthase
VTDLPLLHAGKVRRLYYLGEDRILVVATDTVSAYDVVLDSPIPGKGVILTQLSLWWRNQLAGVVANDLISTDVPADVAGRALVCERLEMLPVECIARGYLAGSAWLEYERTGTVGGNEIGEGLRLGDPLPQPVFTPTTKAAEGEHDAPLTRAELDDLVGAETAAWLEEMTLRLYSTAHERAREHGIIVADTKFEFGRRRDGSIVLADEVLTPDSSRLWDAAHYEPGVAAPSFDKQFLRDWLIKESGWSPTSGERPPALPDEIVEATRARYVEAFERLTGQGFETALEATLSAGKAPEEAAGLEPSSSIAPVTKLIVDVMPKPEILDPQGKAISGALTRMGFDGVTVRQGKRFELTVDRPADDALLAEAEQIAETLLANTVIEDFTVSYDASPAVGAMSDETTGADR